LSRVSFFVIIDLVVFFKLLCSVSNLIEASGAKKFLCIICASLILTSVLSVRVFEIRLWCKYCYAVIRFFMQFIASLFFVFFFKVIVICKQAKM